MNQPTLIFMALTFIIPLPSHVLASAPAALGSETIQSLRQSYLRGDLTPFRIEFIRRARTVDDLRARGQLMDHFEVIHRSCVLELERRQSPYHCFELLESERKIGLRPLQAYRPAQKRLTDLCHLESRPIELSPHDRSFLSTACSSLYHTSVERFHYVESEANPVSSVFKIETSIPEQGPRVRPRGQSKDQSRDNTRAPLNPLK